MNASVKYPSNQLHYAISLLAKYYLDKKFSAFNEYKGHYHFNRLFRDGFVAQYSNSLTDILIQSYLLQEVPMLQLKLSMNFLLLYAC